MNEIKINSNLSVTSQYFSDPGAQRSNQPKPKEIELSENIRFENAYRKAKQYVKINNTKLSLSYDKENKTPVIYVLDNDTNEIIRRIPPEKLVEISGDEEKLKGYFVEKDA
ncbi:MAG: flagellar protein FlaG [Candidatus Marinimicrobia bacterium]|nr:flagellar protein FlaG [Candidatus Neomarinimicrobiota bacterium]